MEEKSLILRGKKEILARLAAATSFVFLFLLYFNLASAYILLGLAVIIFAYVFLRKQLWIFLVLAVPSLVFGKIIHFYVNPGWVYEMSLAEVFILIASAVFLLDKFLSGKISKIKIDLPAVLLFAYLALSIASVWLAVDLRFYVFGLKVAAFSFLSYFLALNLFDNFVNTRIRWFLYSLAATALILSVQIFIKFYQMGWSTKFFFDRSNILIPIGPIATTAAILSLLLPFILAFYFSLTVGDRARPFVLISFVAGSLAVFLTLGKAAILSMLAGLVYLFFKLKNKRIAFALALALFILLSYIFFSSFFIGLFERLSRVFVESNTQFRILEYETGLKIIKNNFWFGVGTGQQLVFFRKMLNWDNPQLVNNFFLQSFIDLGVLGFSLVVLIIFTIFRKIKKILKNAASGDLIIIYGFTASAVAAFLNGLAEVTFFALQYAIIFWLVVGVFSNIKNNLEKHESG